MLALLFAVKLIKDNIIPLREITINEKFKIKPGFMWLNIVVLARTFLVCYRAWYSGFFN